MKKTLILMVKKLDYLSSLSVRLTKITGKSAYPVHPKHLVGDVIWYLKYLKPNDVVLDLGSGPGQSTIKAAKKVKKIIGVEVDQGLIKIAISSAKDKKIKNADFIQLDANKRFPFKDGYFDKIICSDVLEHLNKRNQAFKEIKRVMKKDGRLFLVTDNPDTSWKRLQKSVGLDFYADSEHQYEYPRREIERLVINNGFKIEKVTTATYDTPWRGLIDLTGGFSLGVYKKLRKWRINMAKKHPEETTGFRIVARKV